MDIFNLASYHSKLFYVQSTKRKMEAPRGRKDENPFGCGTVGKAVVSDPRVPLFESSHSKLLFTANCIEKTKIKKKGLEMTEFMKKRKRYKSTLK